MQAEASDRARVDAALRDSIPPPAGRRRLGANAAAKFAAEVVGRSTTLALTIWAARELGAREFGVFSYGLALGVVLAQLADMGLQTIVAREVAARGRAADRMVRVALGLKVVLSLAPLLLAAAVSAEQPPRVQLAFILLSAAMVFQTFVDFCGYVFRGKQELVREAKLLTATRLATAAMGGGAFLLGGALVEFSLAMLVSVALGAVGGFFWLKRDGWLTPPVTAPPRPALSLFRLALPVGVATLLSVAYTRVGVFLLELRAGELEVGTYFAAQRLAEAPVVMPAALVAAVFPAVVAAFQSNPVRARSLTLASGGVLALLGSAFALFFWIAAPTLVPLLYGEAFEESAEILRFLGLALIPSYLNYGLTHLLIARGQQLQWSVFIAAMLVVHATVSWVLIPTYGALAPALSVLVSELLLTACCAATLSLTQPNLARATS